MKRTSFNKKARVKFPVEQPYKDEYEAMEKEAKRLIKLIFRGLYCPVCKIENNDVNTNTIPHHLLNKGMYEMLRFVIWNLLPLCMHHHRWAHDKPDEFLNWLLDNMPVHYRYWESKRYEKSPAKPTLDQLKDIVIGLRHFADNPMEAEKLIYEKD